MSKRRNTAQFGRTEEIRKRLSNWSYKAAGKHIESGYNALADVLNKRDLVLGKTKISAKGDTKNAIEHINLSPDSKEYNLLKSALKTVEKNYGLDTLRDIATQQVFGIISDLDSRTAAGKAKTMMHIAQLLNFRTIGRNIFATAGFSGVDTITNNLAYLTEKTHNFVKGKGFVSDAMGWEPLFNKAIKEAAVKRRNMAFVEQALNVNVLNNENARTGGPIYQRQFTKGIGASLERMLGYALYVPDESFKGAVGERVRRSIENSFMPREINLSMVDEMTNKFSKSISVNGDDTTDYEGVFADVIRKHINNGGITSETLDSIETSIREGIRPKGISDETNPNLTENDLADYIRTGKRLHTKNKKQRMLEAGKKPILTSNDEIKHFISDAIHGKAPGEVRAFKKVGRRLADAIHAKRSSLQMQDRYLELNADDLRESYKRHSTPKEEGNIPLSETDFERIPEYLDEFDGVLSVNTYNGKVEIHLYNKTEAGYIRILTVASNERNSLLVTKLIGVSKERFEKEYGKKIEGDIGSLWSQKIDSFPSTTAQHTADVPSKDSIPQNKRNVNKINPDVIAQKARAVITDKLEELKVYQKAYDDLASFMML